MAEMTKKQRVKAVLHGDQPDRAPVGFWHHFAPDAACGAKAVKVHVRHFTDYDIDFLKVMNDNPYPADYPVRSVDDLKKLTLLTGDEAGYGKQLELIRALRSQLPDQVLVTTLFNAWAVLRRLLVDPPKLKHGPPNLSGQPTDTDRKVSELLREDRAGVGAALDIIARSQARFAVRCIEAGADGVFLSVRDDWVNNETNGLETYDELVRAGDLMILQAASGGWCNMLHVCGLPSDFEAFAAYPVAVINWADRAAGPAIGQVIGRIKPAVCAGVDNLQTLAEGGPEDVQAQVTDALRQAGDHSLIVGPGCTYDPDRVPEVNLRAMVSAVRNP